MWGWPGPLLGALRPREPGVLSLSHGSSKEVKPRKGGGRAGLWAGVQYPRLRGDPPDGWPCLADPDWASYTLGVFICLSCSGIHRNIPHVSKVKSVRLDTWEDVQVEVWPGRGGRWGGACLLPCGLRPQTQPGGCVPAATAASDPACSPARAGPCLPGTPGTHTGPLWSGRRG